MSLGCSDAILIHNGTVIMLQRDKNPLIREPGKIDFVGGMLEEGESHEQALLREVKEEVGIDISKCNIKSFFKYTREDNTTEEFFVVLLNDEDMQEIRKGKEGECIVYCELGSIDKLDLLSSTESFLKDHKSSLIDFVNKMIKSKEEDLEVQLEERIEEKVGEAL